MPRLSVAELLSSGIRPYATFVPPARTVVVRANGGVYEVVGLLLAVGIEFKAAAAEVKRRQISGWLVTNRCSIA